MMAQGRDHTNAFGMTDPRRFSSTPMPQTSRPSIHFAPGLCSGELWLAALDVDVPPHLLRADVFAWSKNVRNQQLLAGCALGSSRIPARCFTVLLSQPLQSGQVNAAIEHPGCRRYVLIRPGAMAPQLGPHQWWRDEHRGKFHHFAPRHSGCEGRLPKMEWPRMAQKVC